MQPCDWLSSNIPDVSDIQEDSVTVSLPASMIPWSLPNGQIFKAFCYLKVFFMLMSAYIIKEIKNTCTVSSNSDRFSSEKENGNLLSNSNRLIKMSQCYIEIILIKVLHTFSIG